MKWESRKEEIGREIVRSLYDNKMILTWCRDNPEGWKLASGKWSPFYINLRELPAFPALLKKVGSGLAELVKSEIPDGDLLVGLAMAGIPIATAISIEGMIPSAFTRKVEGEIGDFDSVIKQYGKHSLVEGRLEEGKNVILVDDLVSYFTSKTQGIKIVEYEARRRNLSNLAVKDILVLLDREQGGKEEAKSAGVSLHSMIPFKSKGIHWLKDDFSKVEYEIITRYLDNPEDYQDEKVQRELMAVVR